MFYNLHKKDEKKITHITKTLKINSDLLTIN